MTETKGGETTQVVSLAFRVRPIGDGLYAAEILMLKGNKMVDSRMGAGTTLGHALGAADNLLDGWALNEVEQKPEDYFKAVFL